MLYYLILAHNNLDQLELLTKKLKTNNCKIYVHLDKKIKKYPKIENIDYVKNRQNVFWGGFSMIKAELSGIKEIYPHMTQGDHIIIISGQCFPIKPIRTIEKYITNLGNKSCIYYTPNKHKEKINRYHFLDLNFHTPKRIDNCFYSIVDLFYKKSLKPHRIHAINSLLYLVTNLFLPRRTYLTNKYTIYSGSQRMILSYVHIERILKFLESNEGKKVLKHFKMTSCSDEIFFQTILLNHKKDNEIINKVIRYIIWLENRNSPEILTSKDLQNIKKSDKLFARKFDITVDKNIIESLSKL